MTFEQIVFVNSIALGWFGIIFVILRVWVRSELRPIDDKCMRYEGALRALVATIKDEGERKTIEAGFFMRNSALSLDYPAVRELIAKHGTRPPAYVTDAIRRIAADASLDEDWKIVAAIGQAFTAEQLARCYSVHGSCSAMFIQVIRECRELGTDTVLLKLGIADA